MAHCDDVLPTAVGDARSHKSDHADWATRGRRRTSAFVAIGIVRCNEAAEAEAIVRSAAAEALDWYERRWSVPIPASKRRGSASDVARTGHAPGSGGCLRARCIALSVSSQDRYPSCKPIKVVSSMPG